MERIQKYLSHLQNALNLLSLSDVRQVIDMVMSAYENDKQIFAIGNGGSASTASHIGCDLGKGTVSVPGRSEEHTSELQSLVNLVCRLLLEKKKKIT